MRQPNYEQALTKCGVQWEYVEAVPLERINTTRGKLMQARLVPIDPDLVDKYAEMLGDGFTPPPLLLWKHGKSLLIPLDGNQRLAANAQAKKRLPAFSAYVVTTDDLMVVDRLCWSFNNLVNGRRLSYEECLEHALTFVRKYNQPITDAAKEWGVKAWELQKRLTKAEMQDLAGRHNITLPKALDLNVLVVVSSLRKFGDDIAVNVLKTVAASGTTQAEAEVLIKDIGRAKTLEAKIKVIDDFGASEQTQQRRAETLNGRVAPIKLPRDQLQTMLDRLEDLLDRYSDKKAFTPVGRETKAKYMTVAKKVANHIISIYGLGALLGDD